MATKHVYFFGDGAADGTAEMKNLLGGKGANLAEMTNLKVPVPAGFTITTEVCNIYYEKKGKYPPEIEKEVKDNLAKMEKVMGKKFGDPKDPLLVSVRSGARKSMPGMMETILNAGLTEETIKGVIEKTGNPRFAWDSYRRLIQMYADVVMEKAAGIEPKEGKGIRAQLEAELEKLKKKLGVKADCDIARRGNGNACKSLQSQSQRSPEKRLSPMIHGTTLGLHQRRFPILERKTRHLLPRNRKHPPRLGHRGQRSSDGLRQHGR